MTPEEFKHYKSLQKGLDIYENETLEQYEKRRIKEREGFGIKTDFNLDSKDKFPYWDNVGLEIISPKPHYYIEKSPMSFEYSWATKKSWELIYRLQKMKSIRNTIIKWVLQIIISAALLVTIVGIMYFVQQPYVSFWCAIIYCELVILVYLYLDGWIECEPNNLKVKHKGKIYT